MGSIIPTLDVVRSKAVTAWTAQSPRRSRNSHIKADRIIRVGELCYPGHTRCCATALRSLPASGRGCSCRQDPRSSMGSGIIRTKPSSSDVGSVSHPSCPPSSELIGCEEPSTQISGAVAIVRRRALAKKTMRALQRDDLMTSQSAVLLTIDRKFSDIHPVLDVIRASVCHPSLKSHRSPP